MDHGNSTALEKTSEEDEDEDEDTVVDGNDIRDGDDEETSSEAEDDDPVIDKGFRLTGSYEQNGHVVGHAGSSLSPESPNVPKSKAMRIKLKMPKTSMRHLRRPPLSIENAQSDHILPLAKKPRILPPVSARKGGNASSETPASNAVDKAKSRIRSLKLPLSQKSVHSTETVQATVVNSDEEDESEGVSAIATVVSSSTNVTPTASNKAMGKRRLGPVRVRIPPLISPGLRVMTTQSSKQQESFSTPSEVFEQAMATAGYTAQARTERPHRGSSIARVVGDMFDSNVKLSLHFPPLVPPDLWGMPEAEDDAAAGENPPNRRLRELRLQVIQGSNVISKSNGKRSTAKRSRKCNYRQMLPIPLTVPYPESYQHDQLRYVREVQEREKAIIRKQEAEVEDQKVDQPEDSEETGIPPIPRMPSPPIMTNQPGFMDEYDDSHHPLHPPKSHPEYVSHLDKNCFHITEGRYFGLCTNKIADPNFIGANAPGIAGVNSAGGAGLATSTSGSGSTSTALTLTSSFHSSALTGTASSDLVTSADTLEPDPVSKKTTIEKKLEKKAASSESKKPAPTPTASTSSLRKVMEEGGSSASALRRRIIRAAVHASRTGNHGHPFTAGEKVYPDVGKAFAAHAGIKPCPRCKNNKQGAYHCRLRRKHFDNDFDGGDSMGELKPLFDIPIEELLLDGE